MFEQLQKIYPSITSFDEKNANLSHEYAWFINEKKDVFGIHKNELTEKDIQLLSTFFKRYNQLLPEKTYEELIWHKRIKQNVNETPSLPYRFVLFSMQKDQIKPTTFNEALSELFGKTIPVLWENETTGIIIEEIPSTDEQINYEQIIDIFMADLSIHIKFYIGEVQRSFNKLRHYYYSLLTIGPIIFQISNKTVINYVQSVPYLLLHRLDEEAKEQLAEGILKVFYDDDEMLKTIEMFLHCNLNVSKTAKKMYLHRNSLQYRIDKFIAETGINIQKFDEAVSVQLALLAKKSL